MLTHTWCCNCCCFLYRNDSGRDQQTKHFFISNGLETFEDFSRVETSTKGQLKKIWVFLFKRRHFFSPFVLGTFTLLPCWACCHLPRVLYCCRCQRSWVGFCFRIKYNFLWSFLEYVYFSWLEQLQIYSFWSDTSLVIKSIKLVRERERGVCVSSSIFPSDLVKISVAIHLAVLACVKVRWRYDAVVSF